MHVTEFLLEAYARGKVSAEFVIEIFREHAAARCAACSDAKGAFESAKGQAHGSSAAEAQDAVGRIGRRMGWDARKLQKEVKATLRDVSVISKLDHKARCEKIGNAYTSYQGPLFGTLLLEEARQRIPAEPAEALDLADAAYLSSHKTRHYPTDPGVQAAALAVRGNAKRALGRLGEADADLKAAWGLLDSPELRDPILPAEVYSYLGSLRRDQGRLDEAARYLRRSGTLYGVFEEPEKAARVQLKLAEVHYHADDFDAAVEAAEQALDLLPPDAEAWLRSYAYYDLAHHLHARGDIDRAEALLADHAELLEASGPVVVQHVVWLRARIAWSREDIRAAERLFREARERALALRRGYEASLLCLELALVYLVQDRTARVKKLCAEALRLLSREEEVEREVKAALALVAEAARREELTRAQLERAIAILERARHVRRVAGEPS